MDQENKPDNEPENNNRAEGNLKPDENKTPEGEKAEGEKPVVGEKPEGERSENPAEEGESTSGQSSAESQEGEPQEGEPQEEEVHFQRLYKSRKNKIIFGICGGLGKYFNIDPVIFRLLFILSLLIGGWGLLIYFIAGIIIPYDPEETAEASLHLPDETEADHTKENTRIVIGSSLILLGMFALLRSTGLIRYFTFFGLTNEIIVPIILIAIGIFLIYRQNIKPAGKIPEEDLALPKHLHLSVRNKKISGVCGGLGEYFGIDPNLIRVLWLIFTFSSFGIGILIYFLFALIVPKEENGVTIE